MNARRWPSAQRVVGKRVLLGEDNPGRIALRLVEA
jgi:hypothetical protein